MIATKIGKIFSLVFGWIIILFVLTLIVTFLVGGGMVEMMMELFRGN